MPVYISSCSNGTIHCLDREGKVRKLVVDATECMFKLCLHKREFERVVRIIKQSKLSGHAIIAYLQKKGFPQVALHFVSDEQTRFNLAVECGNIDVALQAAYALDTKENWHKLGTEALKQGNHQVVEMAYQRTKVWMPLLPAAHHAICLHLAACASLCPSNDARTARTLVRRIWSGCRSCT